GRSRSTPPWSSSEACRHGSRQCRLPSPAVEARGVADANNKASQEQALREWGYKPVRSFDGTAWFEPGVNAIQWIYASLGQENRSLLQEILHQAMRTVERMAAERAEQMRAQS